MRPARGREGRRRRPRTRGPARRRRRPAQCPSPQFTSIQAAVDAAQPGDRIEVCPGTYQEQVRIGKNDLTLFSRTPLAAAIVAPLAMTYPNSIVTVSSANTISYKSASENTAFDCYDETAGSGTAGTANLWIADRGDTANRPGICKH